jgi:uncharacterized membrane protein YfcA
VTELALGAFAIAALAAFAQSVSGFGSALVAVPLLSVLAGPRTAVVTITGLIGMPVGLVLLTTLDGRALTLTSRLSPASSPSAS